MTREEAIKIVEKKLADKNLSGIVKINNCIKGTCGKAQCIYIDRISVKGNGAIIKKLKEMPEFHGKRSINIKNQFDFFGWFEIE